MAAFNFLVTFTTWCLLWVEAVRAFVPPPRHTDKSVVFSTEHSRNKYTTILGSGEGDDWLENLKNMIWGGNQQDNQSQHQGPNQDSEGPAGSCRIATIPGMQNTPDRKSWRADQPSKEEYVIEMLYKDATGMLTVELLEHEIRIDRLGSLPSTQYLMQESVIVQGILDELDKCASEESVAEANRLLIPNPRDAIDAARSAVSFG